MTLMDFNGFFVGLTAYMSLGLSVWGAWEGRKHRFNSWNAIGILGNLLIIGFFIWVMFFF